MNLRVLNCLLSLLDIARVVCAFVSTTRNNLAHPAKKANLRANLLMFLIYRIYLFPNDFCQTNCLKICDKSSPNVRGLYKHGYG